MALVKVNELLQHATEHHYGNVQFLAHFDSGIASR